MMIRAFLLGTTIAAALACGVAAQQNQPQHPMGGAQMPMAAGSLPEECRTAAQAGGHAQMMQGMDMQAMSQNMQGMMASMNEAQKGYMQAMMKMHDPMMTGIIAKDADVAFVCGMIAHHQGAIDMAQVALRTGDNAEAKRIAKKTIKDQGQRLPS
jgi:uncharacterized protein (DUF305 family)